MSQAPRNHFKSIMLLITHNCNLRCSYCYENKNARPYMTIEKAKTILTEQILSIEDTYDSFEIQFMGGEPLLNFPLIQKVSEWLWTANWHKQMLTIFVPTNGTLLNKERKEWFSLNRKKICLGLSFDGNYSMQDLNRSGSSEKVDLQYFSSTWPDQSVKLTISPETVGLLFNGVEYLNNFGFKHISADLAMGNRIPWEKKHLLIFREQIRLIAQKIESGVWNKDIFSMLSIPVLSILSANKEYSGKQCFCGESLVCIDSDGKAYPCHLFSPISLTETEREGVPNICFTDYVLFNSGVCQKCFLNAICNNHCYGMNYKSFGTINKSSPFHCQAFKILFVENCRLQYRMAKINGDGDIQNRIEHLLNIINL